MRQYHMLNDRILFRKHVPSETKGGVFIPERLREPGMMGQGEVLSVGNGRRVKKNGKLHPLTVKPGDLIVYNVRDAMKVDPLDRGEEKMLRIISEGDILAITDERL